MHAHYRMLLCCLHIGFGPLCVLGTLRKLYSKSSHQTRLSGDFTTCTQTHRDICIACCKVEQHRAANRLNIAPPLTQIAIVQRTQTVWVWYHVATA